MDNKCHYTVYSISNCYLMVGEAGTIPIHNSECIFRLYIPKQEVLLY